MGLRGETGSFRTRQPSFNSKNYEARDTGEQYLDRPQPLSRPLFQVLIPELNGHQISVLRDRAETVDLTKQFGIGEVIGTDYRNPLRA